VRLATINVGDTEIAGLVSTNGVIPLSELHLPEGIPGNIFDLIQSMRLKDLMLWYNSSQEQINDIPGIPFEQVKYAPLYRNPSKIWGIGLNYLDHAADLNAVSPTKDAFPVGFMKPDTTIIGHKDKIKIPNLSHRTTGEAELGLIIGKECKNVDRENWIEYIAGYTTIIDMTAEDILRQNTRYLGLSKSFDTFFSFGPYLITPDEVDDVMKLNVSTVLNGDIMGSNTVSNMTFPPDFLIEFHSQIMTLKPGDVISTGTPRAVPLSHGDFIEARIDGFETLINGVVDLKVV
jgi:2-keto-4-pentenoate hydratase/2-oxohepta-3-ene-1,7-dioic acid hydratase in catechol pathway